MRRLLPALLLAALALTSCGDDDPAAPAAGDSPGRFAADVRENFLESCVQNAKETSDGDATDEQLQQTCECILGKIEREYSEAEFAAFEQRLLGDTASEEETSQLAQWSTDCAEEATG